MILSHFRDRGNKEKLSGRKIHAVGRELLTDIRASNHARDSNLAFPPPTILRSTFFFELDLESCPPLSSLLSSIVSLSLALALALSVSLRSSTPRGASSANETSVSYRRLVPPAFTVELLWNYLRDFTEKPRNLLMIAWISIVSSFPSIRMIRDIYII